MYLIQDAVIYCLFFGSLGFLVWFFVKIYLPAKQGEAREEAEHISQFQWSVAGVEEYKDSNTLHISYGIEQKQLSLSALHPSAGLVVALKSGAYIEFDFQKEPIYDHSRYDVSSYILVKRAMRSFAA